MEKKSKKFIQLCKKYGVDPANVPEILSFEDACAATGNNPKVLPNVSRIQVAHQKRIIADYKLSIIADALRGGKYADYTNGEWKYWARFLVKATNKKPSGVGLACVVYVLWYSGSGVGVRLVFPNADLAIFFGKHFIDLHTDHHLLT